MAPPANDNRADAIPVLSVPYENTQSTIDATLEIGESRPFQFGGSTWNHTVWYRISLSTTTSIAITARSDYLVGISTYESSDGIQQGTRINQHFLNAFPHNGNVSQVRFTAQAGQHYLVQVAGVGSAEMGEVSIEVVEAPPVAPNDDRANATDVGDVASNPYLIETHNFGATSPTTGESSAHQATLWWTMTLTEITEVTITLTFELARAVIFLYPSESTSFIRAAGTSLSNPMTATLVYTLQPGTYDILAAVNANNDGLAIRGGVTLSVDGNSNLPPITNDTQSGAISVSSIPYSNTQSTRGATRDAFEESIIQTLAGSVVWYEIALPFDALVTLDTHGSSFGTRIYLVDSTSFEILNSSSGNSVIEPGRSWMFFRLRAGESVYVLIGGTQGDSGDLTFNVEAAVGNYLDESEWNILTMASWDYDLSCDGVIVVDDDFWDDAFYIGEGWDSSQLNWELDTNEFVVYYWEAYLMRSTGEQYALLFHFSDPEWNDVVCPSERAPLWLGVDPYFPKGPNGGWSPLRDRYIGQPTLHTIGAVIDHTSASRQLPDSNYNALVDQSTWEAVVNRIEPLTTDLFDPFNNFMDARWENGAIKDQSSLDSPFFITQELYTSGGRGFGEPVRGRAFRPDAIDPTLVFPDDYSYAPGVWWRNDRTLIDHVGRPSLVRAAIVLTQFRDITTVNDQGDTLSYPAQWVLSFESEPNPPERPVRPEPADLFSMTFESYSDGQGVPGKIDIPAPHEYTVEDVNGTDFGRLEVEVPWFVSAVQSVIDNGTLDDNSLAILDLHFKAFVDAHYIYNLTPPPFGGWGTSNFGFFEHSLGAQAQLNFFFQLEWPQWRYWIPGETQEILASHFKMEDSGGSVHDCPILIRGDDGNPKHVIMYKNIEGESVPVNLKDVSDSPWI